MIGTPDTRAPAERIAEAIKVGGYGVYEDDGFRPKALVFVSDLNALTGFVEQLARMTTPDDEFADQAVTGVVYDSVDDLVADLSDERLCSEYAAFMAIIRQARKLLA